MLKQRVHWIALVLMLCTSAVHAQLSGLDFNPKLPGGLKLGGFSNDKVSFSAEFEAQEGAARGRLHVTCNVPDDLHIYSLTQPKGGPKPTTIDVSKESGIKLLGPFTPNESPDKHTSDVYKGVTIEEHKGKVIWTAPIEFANPKAIAETKIELVIDVLACGDGPDNKSCTPVDEKLVAKFKGVYKQPKAKPNFRDEGSFVTWNASIEPGSARPGDDLKLVVSADIDDGYHIYKSVTESSDDDKNVTLFIFKNKSGLKVGAPSTSSALKSKEGVDYHEEQVVWELPIQVPKTLEVGEHPIELIVGYQECTDRNCLLPSGLKISGTLAVGKETSKEKTPLHMSSVRYGEVIDSADSTGKWVDLLAMNGPADLNAILGALFFGMLGGVILNLMPCVLPVIGLKIMSFVDQAGQNRRQIIALNLWYTLGILTVFWILAGAAIIARTFYGETFSWGEQFTFIGFKLAMIIFVFAMALSFLGTWEIPLPGFASGSGAGKLQEKEGAQGAFAKGVFSTILATPCSGPFLGPVFAFMLVQTNLVVFAVFTAIGIGMALPYLLIGFFPSLISALPKPGTWMETLKQALAFVLLGTVVWLFSTVPGDYRIAVFGTLIATWFGCWIIGRIPVYETLKKRATGWASGICVALALSLFMFHMFVPGKEIVTWEPYTEARLAELQSEGKTVMLDFTADWCMTCQLNFNLVLDTHEMKDYLEQNNIVAMKADWSDRSVEIKNKLAELESNSIPLLAIYPGGDHNNPIVLPDLLTKNKVISNLDSAIGKAPSGGAVALR